MHFPSIYFGFLFESPLDPPIRSSINVDRPIKVYHMAATCPLLRSTWCSIRDDRLIGRSTWCSIRDARWIGRSTWWSIRDARLIGRSTWCSIRDARLIGRSTWCSSAIYSSTHGLLYYKTTYNTHVRRYTSYYPHRAVVVSQYTYIRTAAPTNYCTTRTRRAVTYINIAAVVVSSKTSTARVKVSQ
jgi:hypothetical protein